MRNTILPVATIGAVMIAALGATNGGRGSEHAAQPEHSRQGASGIHAQIKKLGAEPNCVRDKCEDPAVTAAMLAKSESEATLQKTVCHFLRDYGFAGTEREASPLPAESDKNRYCLPASPDQQPEVIVAVLPDPVHTQLALRFDESTDELVNSLQDLGWNYDRNWLPWDDHAHESSDRFAERIEDEGAQRAYESAPGAILFRPNLEKGRVKPLVVLVVGDSPTTGVNAPTFRQAISVWKRLTGWNQKQGKPVVKDKDTAASTLAILGPTFSGSLASLKPLLREVTSDAKGSRVSDSNESGTSYVCPLQPLRISMASGTAGDNNALGALANTPDCKNLKIQAISMDAALGYKYFRLFLFLLQHESIFNDEWPMEMPKRSQQQQPIPDHRKMATQIALLTEAESEFGAQWQNIDFESAHKLFKQMEKDLNNALIEDRKAKEVAKNLRDGKAKKDLEKKILIPVKRAQYESDKRYFEAEEREFSLVEIANSKHFIFPREISKLRAAYEENNIFGFTSAANAVRTQLHLSLSGSAHDDTIHNFSGNQDTAALEAQMGQLAAELERQRITVVLLGATDVLDEIFVTKYLGQHAPNVAVIVMDADGLFLRGRESSMENAYVLSPWPLIPGNEDWSKSTVSSKGQPPVRIHDSAGGQGLYAAARYLVCTTDTNLKSESREALCGASDLLHRTVLIPEYQPPIANWQAANNRLKSEPPLWLSAVGRGGFWPISLIDIDQAYAGLPESPKENLPPLITAEVDSNLSEMPLPALATNGINEANPLSITIITGILALLLLWHGAATLWARLDRGFAWSFALAHEDHHWCSLLLQGILFLAAIPILVLLKVPIEAGVEIRTPHYTEFNLGLQVVAALLSCLPILLLVGVRPLPKHDANPVFWRRIWAFICESCKVVFEALSHWRAALCLLAWFAVALSALWASNRWLWQAIAPAASQWPTERAFFIYRSGHLFCGSAPTLPILILGAALVVYLVSQFDRLVFYEGRIPVLPNADESLRCPVPQKVENLKLLLSNPYCISRWMIRAGVLLIMGLFVAGLHEVLPHSLAHGKLDLAIAILAGVVAFLLVEDLIVSVVAWVLLHSTCLEPLRRSPLRWGFTWIKGWSWRRIWAPSAISPERDYDYLVRIGEANRRAMKDAPLQGAFKGLYDEFVNHPKDPDWAHNVTVKLGALHDQLAKSAANKLNDLKNLWSDDIGPITGAAQTERGLSRQIPLNKELFDSASVTMTGWRDSQTRVAKEEFVALVYLGYIRMVLLQIRNRIWAASAMYILLLWALVSYPFLNHHSIIIGLSCLLAALSISITWVYAQMHRDEILSRTTETEAGKLDADFFTKIIAMVGVPLLSLVASQFPEVSNTIFSWIEPGLSKIN